MFRPWIREHIEVHTDPLYSDIVRTDQFRPDKLAKREFDLGQVPTVSGCFDGVANGKNALKIDDVPDVEIALRDGRLCREEVDKLHKAYKNKAISESAHAELEEADMVSKARAERLGNIIDSISSTSNSSSN